MFPVWGVAVVSGLFVSNLAFWAFLPAFEREAAKVESEARAYGLVQLVHSPAAALKQAKAPDE